LTKLEFGDRVKTTPIATEAESLEKRNDIEVEKTVYVAASHRWLHSKLFERAPQPPRGIRFVTRREDAELIIYLDPPWPDKDAPDRLRNFTAGQLLRTFVFSQSDRPLPWAPGMYASMRRPRGYRTAAAFTGGFYVPHHHRAPGGLGDHLKSARDVTPDLLWSFVGTGQNASVREEVLRLRDPRAVVQDTKRFSDTLRWAWDSTHRDEAQIAFREYATTLGRSKFVLCPRGRGPSSIRLFEALEVGRCPVIISDSWLATPFVDWESCSVRVAEKLVHQIPRILRDREDEADDLGKRGRIVWENFFSPETQLSTLVLACLEISERITTGTRLFVPLKAVFDRSTARRLGSSGRRLTRDVIRLARPRP
jgi:hypothetical protein